MATPALDLAPVGAADGGEVRRDRRIARRAELGRDRECTFGGRGGGVELAVDHQTTRERAEHGGPQLGRCIVAEPVECCERLFEHLDRAALADVAEVEGLVAQESRVVGIVAGAFGERGTDERETSLAFTRIAQVRRRATHEFELAHAGRLGRVGHDVPEAERAFAELGSSGVCRGGPGLAHGLHRGGERPGRIVRAEPVERDLGGEATGARGSGGLVGLGVARMEPRTLAGQQVGEDRLAHERVPERVVVAVDREHAVVHALTRRGVEFVGGAGVDLGQQRVRDAHAAGGDEPKQLLRRVGSRS